MLNSQFTAIRLSDLTEIGNSLLAETTLCSVVLPPGFMGRELGDGVRITAGWAYASNANVKTIKMFWGNSGSTINGRAFADNGGQPIMYALVINKGTFQRCVCTLDAGISGFAITKINSYTEDLNAPLSIRITGQSDTASNDVLGRLLKVEYVPSGILLP